MMALPTTALVQRTSRPRGIIHERPELHCAWVAAFCRAYCTCTREVRFPVKAVGLTATAAFEPSREVMAAAFAIALPACVSLRCGSLRNRSTYLQADRPEP